MENARALRLAKYFGTSPEFWLNLQTSYDLEEAAKEVDLGNVREFDAA
jgi:addiction module HigA family antidote